MARPKAVGIDLGTTYCATAWAVDKEKSVLIPNEEGDLLTPSVVLFEDREVVVGKEAKKVAVMAADRVATCVKRDMGKPVYSKPIRGQYLPPEVIQSYVLRKLKADVTKKIGPDWEAIITVPAYFDEPRRKATHQAGEMAGVKVLDILNEPTAAALAFGEDQGYLTRFGAPKERIRVVVYDLGGGTFDVTLIDMQPGDLRTLATDGDVQLGGYDWDMRLVDYVAQQFIAARGADPRKSPESLQRLLNVAEEAKHTLSARNKATMLAVHEGQSLEVTITREQFEHITADLLERTRYTTRHLLQTAGVEWKDIHKILLTGGSTRMPMVISMLRQLTGIEPDQTVSPDEAVARGAAIYANYLLASKGPGGHQPTFDVTNVNAHSLGIEGIDPRTHRRRNKILIPRNSPLPARRTTECITKQADQRTVVVQVLEGESLEPSECSAIGRTVIRQLPPNLPQGWPIEVSYEYGVNGRLSVRAKVRGTDREVHLDLERDESLSAERVSRWKRVIASGGGLDAFDLAIQQELNELKQQAARGGQLPTMPAAKGPQPATLVHLAASQPTVPQVAPAAPASGGPRGSPALVTSASQAPLPMQARLAALAKPTGGSAAPGAAPGTPGGGAAPPTHAPTTMAPSPVRPGVAPLPGAPVEGVPPGDVQPGMVRPLPTPPGIPPTPGVPQPPGVIPPPGTPQPPGMVPPPGVTRPPGMAQAPAQILQPGLPQPAGPTAPRGATAPITPTPAAPGGAPADPQATVQYILAGGGVPLRPGPTPVPGQPPYQAVVTGTPPQPPLSPPGMAPGQRPPAPAPAQVAFTCPHCRGTFQVPASLAGRASTCPGCRGALIVPALPK
jgi:molecular chaperone DnaK